MDIEKLRFKTVYFSISTIIIYVGNGRYNRTGNIDKNINTKYLRTENKIFILPQSACWITFISVYISLLGKGYLI